MPDASWYDDIVEIVEVRWRYASQMLDHGYKLLRMDSIARSGQHPNPEVSQGHGVLANAGGYYVHKSIVYIMGRTSDIETFDPFEQTHP